MKKQLLLISLAAFVLSSCIVVRQDEVAIKRRAGKLFGEPMSEGMPEYNPQSARLHSALNFLPVN